MNRQSLDNAQGGRHDYTIPVIAICALFIIIQGVFSAFENSVTADEYVHLPIAISILQTHDVAMDHAGSPPLRALLALPALAASPRMDYTSIYWADKKSYQFSWQFMRDNFASYQKLFVLSRMSSVIAALGLMLAVCASASAIFGRRSAAFAAFLFCLNPEIMAHSSLTTVDMLTACFFFLSFHCLFKFLSTPDRNNAIALGLSTGLALLSKYTCAMLPPLHIATIALFLISSARSEDRRHHTPIIFGYLASLAISLTVLNAGFLFDGTFGTLSGMQLRSGAFQRAAASPFGFLPLPLPRLYILAIDEQMFNRNIFTYYLLGNLSRTGWASYYWIAMLVKTPVPILLCSAAAIVAVLRKTASFTERALWITPAAFMVVFTLMVRIDMGVRYLLPVVPFLIVASSGALSRLAAPGGKRAIAAAAICAAYMLSTMQTFGNGLAYFNEFAGGPGGGHRYIIESNLDWGQNLVRLKKYTDATDPKNLLVYNYGLVPPSAYGIKNAGWVPCEPARAVVAISVNYLQGVDPFQHRPKECFSWLMTRKPVTVLGHGLFVFDFSNY